MTVSMILNMWRSSGYCVRHSWTKIGAISVWISSYRILLISIPHTTLMGDYQGRYGMNMKTMRSLHFLPGTHASVIGVDLQFPGAVLLTMVDHNGWALHLTPKLALTNKCTLFINPMTKSHGFIATSYAVGFAVRWKSTFQNVRVRFAPKNVGNRSSSPQNESELSPTSSQSCFPLFQGLSCRKSPSALLSIQLGLMRLQSPIGSKKTILRSDRRSKYSLLIVLPM